MTPGPDDGLPPGEDEGITIKNFTAWEIGAGDFDDRPRLIYPASAAMPATAALTPGQRHKAWTDWRLGPQCQQILLDVASGEREFGDALEAVFMAGIEAALSK